MTTVKFDICALMFVQKKWSNRCKFSQYIGICDLWLHCIGNHPTCYIVSYITAYLLKNTSQKHFYTRLVTIKSVRILHVHALVTQIFVGLHVPIRTRLLNIIMTPSWNKTRLLTEKHNYSIHFIFKCSYFCLMTTDRVACKQKLEVKVFG